MKHKYIKAAFNFISLSQNRLSSLIVVLRADDKQFKSYIHF